MFGKCSGLHSLLRYVEGGFMQQEWRYAGAEVWISTGLSTAVENVQNSGTLGPHTGSFLLKMGKVISEGVTCAVVMALQCGLDGEQSLKEWRFGLEPGSERGDGRRRGGRGSRAGAPLAVG
jgi:hypothetical protein